MMSQLHIYNTLTGKKEKFIPLEEGKIGMYVCGPTLYNHPHIGNMRTIINFDMVYRYLRYLGYDVKYVRNITDAGHLESNGELFDRIGDEAKRVQKQPLEIVYQYNLYFQNLLRVFNTLPPDIEPTATSHMEEQKSIIELIIEKGYAYEVNGSVYFDVKKYNEKYPYGILSGRKLDELYEDTRELHGQEEKRYFADFALWKAVDANVLQRWTSPWGPMGGPGWHIECTAMSTKYLGKQFDIHGGGMDLKFPHHEGEIAQSCAAFDQTPANFWMHSNMLTVNGTKMSKSLGNQLLADELLKGNNANFTKPYSPQVVRFFMMMCHYKSELDISETALNAAETGYNRLKDAFLKVPKLKANPTSSVSTSIQEIEIASKASMDDDFNTAQLIAQLFNLATFINKIYSGELTATSEDIEKIKSIIQDYMVEVLGIDFNESTSQDDAVVGKLMELILKMRKSARENKDWGTSDSIRDVLADANIQVNDEKDGTNWSFK